MPTIQLTTGERYDIVLRNDVRGLAQDSDEDVEVYAVDGSLVAREHPSHPYMVRFKIALGSCDYCGQDHVGALWDVRREVTSKA